MNENIDRKKSTSDDEIDLGLLLLKATKKLKKNTKIILAFLILGLLCGVFNFFTKQPKYESTMVINSTILTKKNAANLLESLQELIDDKNYKMLGSKLSIDSVVAKKISEIKIEGLENEPELDNEKQVFLEVTVTVSNTDMLPQLQSGIVAFLENNRFVKQRVIINKKQYKALIDKTQQEINQVDSLKYEFNKGLLVETGSPNILLMEPVNIFTASLMLFEKKQTYIKQLELVNDIHILKEFTAFKHPTSPRLKINIVLGLVLGLILAMITVFFTELGVYLKRLDREHN